MNEKIKLLAEQSGIKFIPFVVDGEEYDFDEVEVEDSDMLQNFAELIIKECCDWIEGSPSTESGQLLLTKSFIIANLKGLNCDLS